MFVIHRLIKRGNYLFRTETTHKSCLLTRNVPTPERNILISEGQADCAPDSNGEGRVPPSKAKVTLAGRWVWV